MKVKMVYFLLFSLFISSVVSKCKTGQECYEESKLLLQEDRSTLRELDKEFEALINNGFEKEKKGLELGIHKIAEEMEKKLSEAKVKIDEDFTTLKDIETRMVENNLKLAESVEGLEKRKEKSNNMYREAIIYDNIIKALENGVVNKSGTPSGWDDTSYRDNNRWNGKSMIRIGQNVQQPGNGLATNIPEGYNVLWLRNSNHEYGTYKVSYTDGDKQVVGSFTCGFRNLNEISPDGGSPDGYSTVHMWFPIALPRSGNLLIQADKNSTNNWLSGIAFGKNLWNRASNGALAYHWDVNNTSPGIEWETNNWNNDILAKMAAGKVHKFEVPVVKSGVDKILYIVTHGDAWSESNHTSLKVNGQFVERLRTTYKNPFATHFNSKFYMKYVAARVPKELLDDSLFLKVELDLTKQNVYFYFREIGTHDLY